MQNLAHSPTPPPLTRISGPTSFGTSIAPSHTESRAGRGTTTKLFPPEKDQLILMNIKATIVALFVLLVSGAAFGQNGAILSNVVQPLQLTEHPRQATENSLGHEISLYSSAGVYFAQGEVPLAELGSPIYHTPLGDIARAYRKEHEAAPKAVISLER
jgi:hypothetical protein